MPKIFFLDTGLRNFALRNFTELTFRPDKGSLFENTIFIQLYKNLNITDQLFFGELYPKQKWILFLQVRENGPLRLNLHKTAV